MAISVADNFSYQGTKPLDARVSFDTVAAMAAASDATLYDGCFAYVKATQKYYSYDSTNTADPTTGKWREYSSGGGEGKGQSGTGENSEIFNDYTNNTASGNYSHAEGYDNDAVGLYSHVEGGLNTATGAYSHAEGQLTHAKTLGSHASGLGTIAGVNYETVVGRYNVDENNATGITRFVVGNGADQNNRSDAFKVTDTEIHMNGDIKHNGSNLITASTNDITAGTTSLTTGNIYLVYE